ncbi:hypothetical protein PROSTU_04533 [Providencia stuartii ATCC 25827]|uniref:Uncharacterized protein n=1 Tax=Providencia stuartii ATCC 25827 TaxID=471874 RepID=A0AA86YGF9_PROST|nr:hypothetical protein PROSTU_04533 [Providencia stuartii ATCC 25827]
MSFNESWFAGNATFGLQRISMKILRGQQLINLQLTNVFHGMLLSICFK